MEKYYTPEIEEFSYGFRYEYKSDRHLGILENTKGEWSEEFFYACSGQDGESEIQDVDTLIERDDIRVKHLDREDLYSVFQEFKLDFYTKQSSMPNENGDSLDIIRFGGKYSMYFINSKNKTNIFTTNQKNELACIFTGYIKNKSELKRILKQLGICHK